jgi:hypothetical protein
MAGDEPNSGRPDAAVPGGTDADVAISTRVNKPENDDASIVEPVEPATDAA